MRRSKKHIFLSFVGSNDIGKLAGPTDGAILTALSSKKFTDVYLLWNDGKGKSVSFKEIAEYLQNEIIKRNYAERVTLVQFLLDDVADHNKVYPALKSFCDTLNKEKSCVYTAGISSGTPSMQVSWILLAESGDFSSPNLLTLIRSIEPKFQRNRFLSSAFPKLINL